MLLVCWFSPWLTDQTVIDEFMISHKLVTWWRIWPIGWRGQFASSYQMLCRLVKPLLRYDDFFSRSRPFAILDLLCCAPLDHPQTAYGIPCLHLLLQFQNALGLSIPDSQPHWPPSRPNVVRCGHVTGIGYLQLPPSGPSVVARGCPTTSSACAETDVLIGWRRRSVVVYVW